MQNERSKGITNLGSESDPHTISGINQLPDEKKWEIYCRLIPQEVLTRFNIPASLQDAQGRSLLKLNCQPGSASVEMGLFHIVGFPDPLLYGDMTDTLNGQIHVLLYMLNDPASPRFDTDLLQDGTSTRFGTQFRNLEAEVAAMKFGLAPGQVRRGLRLFGAAVQAFENFVASLGHELFFADPLHYHNAIIFERYGFAYEKGRRLMERIRAGFSKNGDLLQLLDGSTPFRSPEAANSIRLRSWAIHDNLLGEPFDGVTMYKLIGKSSGVNTCPGCEW